MVLGDCFTPDQLVKEIFRQQPNLTAPIPIEDIAAAVGISEIRPISTDDVEGMLVADEAKSTGVIFYKDSSPIGRQRFTIGHELGHFLLLHHGFEQRCSTSDIRFGSSSPQLLELENEANEFSQSLLMPNNLISEAIHKSPISMEHLKSISETFKMSFEAISNKCANLCETPIALVYSRNNIVRYCWRDFGKFPHRIPLKNGDSLPSSSIAHGLQRAEETISQPFEIDAKIWLKPYRNLSLPTTVIEQTYTQLDGYQVTMIKL